MSLPLLPKIASIGKLTLGKEKRQESGLACVSEARGNAQESQEAAATAQPGTTSSSQQKATGCRQVSYTRLARDRARSFPTKPM